MSDVLAYIRQYRGRLDLSSASSVSITALGHLRGLEINGKGSSLEAALASVKAKMQRSRGAIGARLRVELQKIRRKIEKTEASDRKPGAGDLELESELRRLIGLIDPEPVRVGQCKKCERELRGRAFRTKGEDGKAGPLRFEADVYEIGEGGSLTCSGCSFAALEVGAELELVVDAEELEAIPEKKE